MKAMVYHEYGSPNNLEMQEVEKPAVKDDEVLVKVHVASVNALDWHSLTGTPFLARIMAGGLLKPRQKILGVDLAGRVEAVGTKIARFQPGDKVFGGSGSGGALAEYACAGEDNSVPKPANLTFEQAAAVGVSAITALHALRDQGKVQPGQKALINGASGGVGPFAVQIAKAFGADVTGVCSTANLDLARSLGADAVIDYTQEDFTRSGETYDIVFDAVGKLSSSRGKSSLKQDGRYLSVAAMTSETTEKLVFLRKLVEAGELRAVIDRRYPLEKIAEAHRYVEKGHKKGNVVINAEHGEKAGHCA